MTKIKKIVVAIILFIFPSCIALGLIRLFGCKTGHHCKVGFSWVCCDKIEMGDQVTIGHLNLIILPYLSLADNARIKHINAIKGGFDLILDGGATINQFNKITNSFEDRSTCKLKKGSIIGVKHVLDLTASFEIGEYSIMAGILSQVWTHAFYHSITSTNRWRINGDVKIGKNVYIGAGCIINPGITVCDNCTIGAGAVVSKDIEEPG
ncbi:MAG: DapH/DapD/GlmU-related protein, partial [Odoribacter sp.]